MRFILGILVISAIFSCAREPSETGEKLPVRQQIGKPTAPIDLSIACLNTPKVWQSVRICFTASPQIYAPNFEMKIKLPSDLRLLKGSSTDWKGELGKGKSKKLLVEFTIPDETQREIIGIATIYGEGKTRLARVCSLIIGKPSKSGGKVKR